MGSVWLAEDQLLERSVALKELIQHVNDPDRDERRIRAMREARAMARVHHPAIVRIHDVFVSGADPWIVMEYVSGHSLAEIIASNRRLDEWTIARIGLPVLLGLSAAHRAKVVHRDVKPANILVAEDDSVFLVDFGIAKIAGDMSLTATRTVLGTPEFLAPERLSDRPVGPAADLWSLGVTFFYALEGYSPFLRKGERSHEATTSAILYQAPPRPRNRGRLADVILRLLNKDPSQRIDAEELAEILQSIINEPKTPVSAAAVPRTGPEPTRAQRPNQPPSSRHRPPGPAGTPLAGARLEDARNKVREVGTDAGVALLLAMPDDHAAQVLAGYPAHVAGGLIQVMAMSRPQTAGTILQTLSAASAGRAMDYLTPGTAASLLIAMSPGAAAPIVSRTDVRTGAAVIMELPVVAAAELIRGMKVKRAVPVLEYVKPVTVAALLLTLPDDLRAVLLREFDSSFRTQVGRHLKSRLQEPPGLAGPRCAVVK